MERGVAAWLVVAVVVVSAAVPGVSVAAAPGASAAAAPAGPATQEDPFGLPQEFDPDTVSLSADLQDGGDAQWQFTYRMQLETDNETRAFEQLRDDINANTTAYLDRFRDRITNTVDAAENATGREMAVENVSVSTRVNSLNEDSLGVVTYSFEWQGFAAVDGDRVTAGDALGGFYLDNQTSLTVSWPSGYELESVDPVGNEPRERAVSWSGPLEFGANQPRVEVAPTPDPTTTSTTTTADDGGVGGTGGDGGDGGDTNTSSLVVPAAVGAVVAVLVLGAGGWLYLRQREPNGSLGSGVGGENGAGGGPGDGGAAAAAGAGGAAGGESESDDGPPSELLSNEERVEQFLESQGGRAKQQAVVEALDWTEAKTSQVVNEMQEAGTIEKFRIGRENVLKLPEADDLDE